MENSKGEAVMDIHRTRDEAALRFVTESGRAREQASERASDSERERTHTIGVANRHTDSQIAGLKRIEYR